MSPGLALARLGLDKSEEFEGFVSNAVRVHCPALANANSKTP
jgi:hypothetical protein